MLRARMVKILLQQYLPEPDSCSAANDLQASSARTSSVERISMPSFAVLQTNARTDPLFDLHRRLQSFGRSIPTILITGQPNENVRTQALSLGIICYLPKPFRDDDLIDSIHSALRSRQASGAAVSPPPLPPRWLSLIRRHE